METELEVRKRARSVRIPELGLFLGKFEDSEAR
jgi:hypothetical protein